jgi:hypothetical protein
MRYIKLISLLMFFSAFAMIANYAYAANVAPHAFPLNSNYLKSQKSQAQQNSNVPLANWDHQMLESFGNNVSYLSYNVIAVVQNGSYGYGPGYLVNGLSNKGYWYQAGLSYDWPGSTGFKFLYAVFNNQGTVVDPTNGSYDINFSGAVNPGDKVIISLYFINGNVLMYGSDQNTKAFAEKFYSAQGATYFVGNKTSNVTREGFFTGLMTEEYHVLELPPIEKEVPYVITNVGIPITSAWLIADNRVPANGLIDFQQNSTLYNLSFYSSVSSSFLNRSFEIMTKNLFLSGQLMIKSLTESNAIVYQNQETTFTATPVNGTAPYTYTWLMFFPNKTYTYLLNNSKSSTFKFATNSSTPPGNYIMTAIVIDSERDQNSASIPFVVKVLTPLTVAQPTLSATKLDVFQSITIKTFASGGLKPYSYDFSINNVTGGQQMFNGIFISNSIDTGEWGFAGTFHANVSVTDSSKPPLSANSIYSANFIFKRYPLTYLTASNYTVSPNQKETFNALLSGGWGPFTVKFENVNNGVIVKTLSGVKFNGTATYTFNAPSQPGNYLYNTIITDSGTTQPYTVGASYVQIQVT